MITTPQTPSPLTRAVSRSGLIDVPFSTPPADAFPTPTHRIKGRKTLALNEILELQRAASTPPEITSGSRPLLSSRPAEDLPSASGLEQSWACQQLSKKRSQYYDGAFAYREACNTARNRVARDSLVMAEVKINFSVSQY